VESAPAKAVAGRPVASVAIRRGDWWVSKRYTARKQAVRIELRNHTLLRDRTVHGEAAVRNSGRYRTTDGRGLRAGELPAGIETSPVERKLLGFSFTTAPEPKRRIAPKALKRFKQRVRELTSRTRGISLAKMVEELSTYLRGWHSYFGYCQTPTVLQALEQWRRRRLRSVLWKQWKRGRTRFDELRKRGIAAELAAKKKAGSAHRPWRLANSPALDHCTAQCVL
jgi:hypothetical protein